MVGMVIVTGGSLGIGAAIAHKLGSLGYAVAVNYFANPDAATAVADAIRSAGGRADAVRCDIGDPTQIEPMFAAAEAALGPLTALVNNAGIVGERGRLDVQVAATLNWLFTVNVIGTMLCTAAAIRRLSTRHGGLGGAIVNLGLIAGRTGGLPGIVPYAARASWEWPESRGIPKRRLF